MSELEEVLFGIKKIAALQEMVEMKLLTNEEGICFLEQKELLSEINTDIESLLQDMFSIAEKIESYSILRGESCC